MWTDNLVFYKSKGYLNFCTSIGVDRKPSPRLSTHLYSIVYFDRRDQFNPSMSLSNTWSGHYGQTCKYSCVLH